MCSEVCYESAEISEDTYRPTMAEKGHDCKHSPFRLPLYTHFFLQNNTRRFFLQNYTPRFFNTIIYLHAT